MTEPHGEVFDLGYQHYAGPREGRMRPRKALWMSGVRTALGLGRGSRAKILPVLLFASAMAPAVILTPLTEDFLKKSGKYDYQMGHIPLGRFATAEDLIGTLLLLASEAGAFITGQTIYVDGGRTLV